ncbi:UbiA family prenyltransferase [Streptoalloteichus hindustanus]|uniref:4-hydroxybenzoate polyprenyltransferase n=1 Tax=Streptoalloteichus hindustanus TaxID=2017 RepID=A0A1M4YIG1_STRHI|nr:UbiA family prenyltransferase [Streptoalloteichus hindustanus]SHF05413.1 4-hydroxybenzoate polyprenyltransferase [Streptoalloteichus hindustanus]
MGHGLVALARAGHPGPTLVVTAATVALAAAVGRGPAALVAVGATQLTTFLSIGWLNDYLDASRDAAVGRADKPVPTGAVSRELVGACAVLAALACVPLSALSGPVAGVLQILVLAAGWGYDLGLKATAISVVPFVVAFGLLPAVVVTGAPGVPLPPLWLVVAGALLGSGAHFANVLHDLRDDAATGVRGLPHRLGAPATRAGAAVLMLVASAVLVLGPGTPSPRELVVVALAAAVLAYGLASRRRRVLAGAVQLVALLDVALLLVSGAALR